MTRRTPHGSPDPWSEDLLLAIGFTLVALGAWAGGCSTRIPGNVPGFDSIEYVGDRAPVDIGRALSVWKVHLAHETGVLWDPSDLRIEEVVRSPYERGYYEAPARVVYEASTWPVGLLHECTHVMLDRTQGDPDTDVAMDSDGHCLDLVEGICSHADARGPWTLVHDRATQLAVDDLERLLP